MPLASRPAFVGVSPSTSLPGSIAATTASGRCWSGSGSWTRIPSTSSSAPSARDQLEQLLLGGLAAQAVVDRAHPGLLAGLVLVGDVDLRGGVVADEHRRQRRRAAALASANSATSTPDPLADLGGDRLAVDDRGRSSPASDRRVVGHQLALGAVAGEADDDHAAGLDRR